MIFRGFTMDNRSDYNGIPKIHYRIKEYIPDELSLLFNPPQQK